MVKSPTIPSLTMKIYKTKFFESDGFVKIKGKLYNTLKKSFFGGLVDAFKPYGENLFQYDINSHYPAMMLKDMPKGNPIHIIGDVDIGCNFGFFNVDVKTPKDLNVPILPVHTCNKTIAASGKWNGWYFGEELKEAKKLGYTFKVKEAYIFEKFKPFDNFVNHFYDLKKNAKGTNKKIAKLCLNSLYGKLASSEILFETKIIDNLDSLDLDFVSDIIKLDDKFMVDEILKETNHRNLVNIATASAITAYGRIEINKYKNIKGNECFYSDTDSVILQKELPNELVSNELGYMKLEHKIKRGIFIAAKTFCIEKEDNTIKASLKGISSNATLDDYIFKGEIAFKALMDLRNCVDKNIIIFQHKFVKDKENQKIFYKKLPFKISIHNDKRVQIIKNNKLINTKPIEIDLLKYDF